MNITYHVINSDPKKTNKIAAQELMDKLAGNWAIVSAVGAGNAVHYILVEQDLDPAEYAQLADDIHVDLTDEDAAVIRDNLDTTHVDKR